MTVKRSDWHITARRNGESGFSWSVPVFPKERNWMLAHVRENQTTFDVRRPLGKHFSNVCMVYRVLHDPVEPTERVASSGRPQN